MSELRLYAVGIDEVRDVFGADADLTARLTDVARRRWFDHAPRPRRGFLDLLGPLTKEPVRPQTPDVPTPDDAAALLAGRYLAPDRTLAAWRLLDAWVTELAWDVLRLELDAAELAQLDFDIVAAGVPNDLTVEKCFRHEAHLPLRPLAGMRVGYARHAQVLAMNDDLTRVSAQVVPRSREAAATLDAWLDGFAAWGTAAPAQGRPAPDLIALWLA